MAPVWALAAAQESIDSAARIARNVLDPNVPNPNAPNPPL